MPSIDAIEWERRRAKLLAFYQNHQAGPDNAIAGAFNSRQDQVAVQQGQLQGRTVTAIESTQNTSSEAHSAHLSAISPEADRILPQYVNTAKKIEQSAEKL